MIALVAVLLAFPFGYFIASRPAANVAYAIAYLWAFTFQTLYLLRAWVGGDHSAFPEDPEALPVSYGIVALSIFAAGFGLVSLGHLIRQRRRVAA